MRRLPAGENDGGRDRPRDDGTRDQAIDEDDARHAPGSFCNWTLLLQRTLHSSSNAPEQQRIRRKCIAQMGEFGQIARLGSPRSPRFSGMTDSSRARFTAWPRLATSSLAYRLPTCVFTVLRSEEHTSELQSRFGIW